MFRVLSLISLTTIPVFARINTVQIDALESQKISYSHYSICICNPFLNNYPGLGLIGYQNQNSQKYVIQLFNSSEFADGHPTQKGMEDAERNCDHFKNLMI